MQKAKDIFLGAAENYERYRVPYPQEVFDWIVNEYRLVGSNFATLACAGAEGRIGTEADTASAREIRYAVSSPDRDCTRIVGHMGDYLTALALGLLFPAITFYAILPLLLAAWYTGKLPLEDRVYDRRAQPVQFWLSVCFCIVLIILSLLGSWAAITHMAA